MIKPMRDIDGEQICLEKADRRLRSIANETSFFLVNLLYSRSSLSVHLMIRAKHCERPRGQRIIVQSSLSINNFRLVSVAEGALAIVRSTIHRIIVVKPVRTPRTSARCVESTHSASYRNRDDFMILELVA